MVLKPTSKCEAYYSRSTFTKLSINWHENSSTSYPINLILNTLTPSLENLPLGIPHLLDIRDNSLFMLLHKLNLTVTNKPIGDSVINSILNDQSSTYSQQIQIEYRKVHPSTPHQRNQQHATRKTYHFQRAPEPTWLEVLQEKNKQIEEVRYQSGTKTNRKFSTTTKKTNLDDSHRS